MHVHNTESGRLEELVPRVPGRIGMYVCGPTVYAAPHLGHARMAIAFDVIRKYLAFSGFEVTFVSNYTDVDDKIILRAREEGIAPTAVAGKYEQAWERAMGALRVRPPDVVPRATEHIPQMLELVERLIERGFAYPADGDVYFAVERFPGYGRLSHQSPADLRAGARVEPGERKRNPLDFVLWKGAKEGEPAWESPWGPGRPGWHIECSAMSLQYLGMGFDIHGAGSDLVFPHHENELAQAEAASGESPFVRYWIHSGLVSLGGDKMSKSTGNLVSADEALARYTPEAIRLLALQTHYRSPLDFSEELIADAATAGRPRGAVGGRGGRAPSRLLRAPGGRGRRRGARRSVDGFLPGRDGRRLRHTRSARRSLRRRAPRQRRPGGRRQRGGGPAARRRVGDGRRALRGPRGRGRRRGRRARRRPAGAGAGVAGSRPGGARLRCGGPGQGSSHGDRDHCRGHPRRGPLAPW